MTEWRERKADLAELIENKNATDVYRIVSGSESRHLAEVGQRLLGFSGECSEGEIVTILRDLKGRKNRALAYLGMIEFADELDQKPILEVLEELAKGHVAKLRYLIGAAEEALELDFLEPEGDWRERKEDLEELFHDEIAPGAYSIVSTSEAEYLASVRQSLIGFSEELSEENIEATLEDLNERRGKALMYLGMVEFADELGERSVLEVWEELAKGYVAEIGYLISAADEALD